jgi:hypothetical protein
MSNLFLPEAEIQHSQGGIELFVVVFREAVFLDAQPNMSAMDLDIRLYYPLVSIQSTALEEKGMGPQAPTLSIVKVSLGAADRLVNEGGAAREPNTARQSIPLEEFTVGKAGDHDGLILDGIQRWLRNGNGRY